MQRPLPSLSPQRTLTAPPCRTSYDGVDKSIAAAEAITKALNDIKAKELANEAANKMVEEAKAKADAAAAAEAAVAEAKAKADADAAAAAAEARAKADAAAAEAKAKADAEAAAEALHSAVFKFMTDMDNKGTAVDAGRLVYVFKISMVEAQNFIAEFNQDGQDSVPSIEESEEEAFEAEAAHATLESSKQHFLTSGACHIIFPSSKGKLSNDVKTAALANIESKASSDVCDSCHKDSEMCSSLSKLIASMPALKREKTIASHKWSTCSGTSGGSNSGSGAFVKSKVSAAAVASPVAGKKRSFAEIKADMDATLKTMKKLHKELSQAFEDD